MTSIILGVPVNIAKGSIWCGEGIESAAGIGEVRPEIGSCQMVLHSSNGAVLRCPPQATADEGPKNFRGQQ